MSSGETGDRRLGIVGAGKVGTTIARAAIAAGYDVAMSGSGTAQRIALTVDVLAPGARAVSTDEVVRHADLIVLAVPTHRFRELPRDLFAGKILIDASFYQINPATAAKGVNLLVDQGILYKKRGLGMYVASGARARLLEKRREQFFEHYVVTMLQEAEKLGITTEQLTEMIQRRVKAP